ncbi:MAG: hypothetical protein JW804_03265 [Sedimentisphaerales bacterium]|nr:hypothetical protein [Sedimentisphaerales bacterium]
MKSLKNKKAMVLPLIIILMVILILVGYGMLSLGYNARIQSLRHVQDIRAIAAAEAGIEETVIKMNEKLSSESFWNNDTLDQIAAQDVTLTQMDALYSFDVTGSPSTGFVINSNGECGPIQRNFHATMELRSVFEFSILVKHDLVLYPNSSVLAYNSTTGENGLDALIGTNSVEDEAVIIMNGAYVEGDVLVGATGEPTDVIKNSGTVTGDMSAMPQMFSFPEIDPPTGLPNQGSINGPALIQEPTGSGQYSSISLGNSDVLEVSGHVVMYVTGDIIMNNGAEIAIKNDGNSSLTLYIDGNLISKEDAGINNETAEPSNFKLYGTGGPGQSLDLKAKNDFYGAVYAPNAILSIKAKGDIYGSFIGDSFEMKSKSTFNHDWALVDVDINSEGTFFSIQKWYED